MSRRPKNNHYHFAEQYSDGHYRRKARAASVLLLPRRAVFFAVLVLLVLGVVTATFSVNVGVEDDSAGGSILVSVRNAKANRDLAVTGANVDLAATGYSVTGGKVISLDDNTAKFTDTYGSNVYLVERTSNKQYFYKFNRVGDSYYYALSSTARSDLSDGCMIVFLGKNVANGSTWDNTWADFEYWGPDNSSFEYKHGIYCGIQNISDNTRFTLPASGNATSQTGTPEGVYDNGIDVQLQYKIGTGSYTNASSSVTPGTTAVTLSAFNSGFTGGSSSTTNVTTSNHFDRVAKNTNMTFKSTNGTGFTFVDYYNNTASVASTNNPYTVSNTYASNTNHTIYARFEARQYSITYNLTGGKTVDHAGQNPSTTPANADVAWANNYTAPASRYYTQSKELPVAANLSSGDRNFLGWYTSADCSGNAVTSISATEASNVTLYAKWEWKSFTITYNDGSGSPVTGEISGTVAAGTKTYGVDYTLSSDTFTRAGYTQVGWATTANYTSQTTSGGTNYYALGGTYPDNSNVTLYPVWELKAPTKSADSSDAPTIRGGTITIGSTFDLQPSITSCPADAGRSYTWNITSTTTSVAGLTIANDSTFTPVAPGTYTITCTVTDTCTTGVTGGAKSSTFVDVTNTGHQYVTVVVQPTAPLFTLDLIGKADGEYADRDGTPEHPYVIISGNRYYFAAAVTNAVQGYTYEWSRFENFNTLLGTGTTIDLDDQYNVIDPANRNPDERSFATDNPEPRAMTLYCRAVCNTQASYNNKTVNYSIQPLVKSFKFVPFQKIYNAYAEVSIAAEYNFDNAQGYNTVLKFSPDNLTYQTADTAANVFITDFTNTIQNFFKPSGPKYFYMQIDGVNSLNEQVTSLSPKVHTTVDSSSSSATVPIYFYNNVLEGNNPVSLKNYLVMCYYIDGNGEIGYQAAQDLNKGNENSEGLRYRVNIPSDASAIRFGFIDKEDNVPYYGLATIDANGDISGFDYPVFKGSTQQIAFDSSYRVITATANPGTTQTVDGTSHTLYYFTCTTDPYSPAN